MVLSQIGEPSRALYRASLQDRTLSLFIDVVVMTPLFSILLSPLVQRLQIQMTFSPESQEFWIFLLLTAFSYIFFFYAYQTFCVWRWRATLGQRVFKLQVRSLRPGETSISLGQAALRAFGFFCSWIPFGLPFLNFFAHPERKALHDLLSETEVVSPKPIRFEDRPQPLEKHFVRNTLASLSFVFLLWGVLVFKGMYEDAVLGVAKQNELKADGYLCSVDENVSAEKRMDWVLAHHLAGELSAECVEKEADFALWTQSSEQRAWGYLAKSHLESDSEFRKLYYEKVCETAPHGNACLQVTQNQSPSETAKVLHWRRLFESGKWKELQQSVQGSGDSNFVSLRKKYVSQLLWIEGKKSEALAHFEGVLPFLGPEMQNELATWMCFEEVESNCSSQVRKSCEETLASMVQHQVQPTPEGFASVVLSRQCQSQGAGELITLFPQYEALARLMHRIESNPLRASVELAAHRFAYSENLRTRLWARAVSRARGTLEVNSLLAVRPKPIDAWLSLKTGGAPVSTLRLPASQKAVGP